MRSLATALVSSRLLSRSTRNDRGRCLCIAARRKSCSPSPLIDPAEMSCGRWETSPGREPDTECGESMSRGNITAGSAWASCGGCRASHRSRALISPDAGATLGIRNFLLPHTFPQYLLFFFRKLSSQECAAMGSTVTRLSRAMSTTSRRRDNKRVHLQKYLLQRRQYSAPIPTRTQLVSAPTLNLRDR